MNLLAELKAERASTITDTRALVEKLAADTKSTVEQYGGVSPVVVALDGSVPHYYHLEWSNPLQKVAAFKNVEDDLRGRHVSATVFTLPGRVTLKHTGEEVNVVMVIAHTLDWKEMLVLPYTLGPNGVTWSKPMIEHNFKSNLLRLPYGETN